MLLEHLNVLQENGYTFALDNYTGDTTMLMDVADIIKVDFRLTTSEMQTSIALKYWNKLLLAEKVETEAVIIRAKRMKYQLFQGYYFSKPTMLSQETVEIALGSYLRLWREINNPKSVLNSCSESFVLMYIYLIS